MYVAVANQKYIYSMQRKKQITTRKSALSAFAIVQEYCRLSKLVHPSDKELNRIGAILELTQYDPELSNLINEADHLIAYELGLSQDLPSSERDESNLHEKRCSCSSSN